MLLMSAGFLHIIRTRQAIEEGRMVDSTTGPGQAPWRSSTQRPFSTDTNFTGQVQGINSIIIQALAQ
jgi:hypothetical protein